MEFTESTKTIICKICGDKHTIDKYNWIDSCIGYFWMGNWDEQIIKYYKEKSEK